MEPNSKYTLLLEADKSGASSYDVEKEVVILTKEEQIRILRIEGTGKYFNTEDALSFKAATNHDSHYVNLDDGIYPEKALTYTWKCTDLYLQSPCLNKEFEYVFLEDSSEITIPAGSLFPEREYLIVLTVTDHISNTEAEEVFTFICAAEPVAVLEIVSDADATGYLELSNGGKNVFKAFPLIEDI